ncbi:hypothetical protein FKM82_003332 [Ascaphus truei]
MSKQPPMYFPSLYDRSVSTSPMDDFNIWKNLCAPLQVLAQPQCLAVERSPWPPGLANIVYEPLCFFSTPPKGDCAPRPSYLDEICELEIKIKELELLTITGDAFDSQKYTFLKSVKDKKIQDMKAWQVLQKQTFAS